jgi:hypothetical protein
VPARIIVESRSTQIHTCHHFQALIVGKTRMKVCGKLREERDPVLIPADATAKSQIGRQADRNTGRQADRETDRQADKRIGM